MSSISSSLTSNASSGLDVQATVDQLIYTERGPERLMQLQQTRLENQASSLANIQTKLSTLEDSVFALRSLGRDLNAQLVTSSNSAVVTATAETNALAGTHTLIVSNLATPSAYCSKTITDSAFKFGANSTMSLKSGSSEAVNLVLDGKTLDEAAAYINDSVPGALASVIRDVNGSRLSLTSTQPGIANALTISNDLSGLAWKSSATAQNAKFSIDGVDIEAASNTVSGVLTGVTLSLAAQSAGQPVTLSVGPDTGRASRAINSFVSSYNSLITEINSQFAYNSSTQQSGVLASDCTLLDLQHTLLSNISYTLPDNGSHTSLRSLGVTMNDDGTLKVDSSVLDQALKSNNSEVRQFFQSDSSDSPGFAEHLDTLLTALTSPTGPVAADLQGIRNSSKAISTQIDDFEVRIAARQQQLLDQYTRIDVLLRQFSATQTQISSQLGALSNSK